MKKLFIFFSLVVVISLLMTSCTKNKAIFGSTDQDNIYVNKYFDFKVSLPSSWHIYTDDERFDLTMGYYLSANDREPDDYTEVSTVLLMIAYRDQVVEQSEPDEHSNETHPHITPLLSPGIVINAVKGKEIPEDAVSVTIDSRTMFQEDVMTDTETYTYLYYPVNDYVVLIKLNYHDEQEALLVMDVLNTMTSVN